MTSDADKIKKLKALIADPAAADDERAAAREKIAEITHAARGMSDAELAATIARLKNERAAIPIPHDVEPRRKEKREEIERHEKERNKRYKKKLKAMTDEEVAALIADPAAADDERAAAREKIAEITHAAFSFLILSASLVIAAPTGEGVGPVLLLPRLCSACLLQA